mmetsp:Transcript_30950/g.52933  ORF Transcript_30950/g.52933 Transcript_30950/m.52933 type:complete len:84 (+) Transcript_30950:28-279(+)
MTHIGSNDNMLYCPLGPAIVTLDATKIVPSIRVPTNSSLFQMMNFFFSSLSTPFPSRYKHDRLNCAVTSPNLVAFDQYSNAPV